MPDSLFPQSLHVFFGLPLGLAPSTSYSIHFFTQSLSSFRNTGIFYWRCQFPRFFGHLVLYVSMETVTEDVCDDDLYSTLSFGVASVTLYWRQSTTHFRGRPARMHGFRQAVQLSFHTGHLTTEPNLTSPTQLPHRLHHPTTFLVRNAAFSRKIAYTRRLICGLHFGSAFLSRCRN